MEDLLFTNVELYDGTGKPPFMADVAVHDDKIAGVAPTGTLKRTGCAVIDGFTRTVSAAASEVTLPPAFLMMQRYWYPLREVFAGTVSVSVVLPVSVVLAQLPSLLVR